MPFQVPLVCLDKDNLDLEALWVLLDPLEHLAHQESQETLEFRETLVQLVYLVCFFFNRKPIEFTLQFICRWQLIKLINLCCSRFSI